MKRVIFVAFSDIQIEDWKRFSTNHSRLEQNGVVLSKVRDLCIKYNCPALFTGDLFDDPASLKNYLLQRTLEWLNSFKRNRIKIYAIDGNHDQCEKNSITHRSPNYIRTLSEAYSNIIDLGNNTMVHEGIFLSGIPYMTDNKDFVELVKKTALKIKPKNSKHILLIHTDLPGVKEPNGREIEHQNLPTDIYKIFKPFDLVLNGHIHRPQNTYQKIFTLGATHQQRVSDEGCTMGIWLIREDLTMKFIPLGMPEFKYIQEGEQKPDDKHMYVEVPKEVEIKEGEVSFLPSHSPIKLVKRYLKKQGIKSKKKESILFKYLSDARDK